MHTFLDVDWSALPKPEDDGAADHLPGRKLASLELRASDGTKVDLSRLDGLTIVFIYPRTGQPEQALPPGWDAIPGARGCTPHLAVVTDRGIRRLFDLERPCRAQPANQPPAWHLSAAARGAAQRAAAAPGRRTPPR